MDTHYYRRARVAITPVLQIVPVSQEHVAQRYAVPIHVGHVRTLLLGSLIAKELNTEFHVRLDMNLASPDKSDCVMDIVNCLITIGIEYDYIYATGLTSPNYSSIAERIGDEQTRRLKVVTSASHLSYNHSMISSILDDLIDFAPSLIIRGMEFKRQDAETCGECNVPGLAGHMAVVEFLREFMDFPTHEINVPLILMRQRQKMGKSMQSVPWMSLTMAAPELVKRFLIATAISPDDPFNVLYEPFELDKMSTTPYLWLWSDWAKVVKMS